MQMELGHEVTHLRQARGNLGGGSIRILVMRRTSFLTRAPSEDVCHSVVIYIGNSRYMDSSTAIMAMSALAQGTRLNTFKWLVKHEPDGIAAGELARLLNVPQNTLSTHLALLSKAGLVTSERHSRSIVYRAKLEGLRAVVLYLLRDCCNGHAALCVPIISELTNSCSSPECCP